MARVKITVEGYKCERCGHEWIPRAGAREYPRVCPYCKTAYWDSPRKRIGLDYRPKVIFGRDSRTLGQKVKAYAAAHPELPYNQRNKRQKAR